MTEFDPPDKTHRELIERDLKSTMLVEAAAGTGKTTSMVRRMVALLEDGEAEIHHMAAVTFTRKAAAELRSRFQLALEQAATSGPRSARLEKALAGVERCFIGTIHSFCARLLRERPVEAGVDVAFMEMDDNEDSRVRRAAWDMFTAREHAAAGGRLKALGDLGIELGTLRDAFITFADYPDVDEWPVPLVDPPDFAAVAAFLQEVAAHVDRIEHLFGNSYADQSGLMRTYGRIKRMIRYRDLGHLDMVEILKSFSTAKAKDEVDSGAWPGGAREAKEEAQLWKEFKGRADGFVRQWRRHCYPACMDALHAAGMIYEDMREQSGRLNYQDLLIKASELLRDKPVVRRYFRGRFSHVLVDEFQDTDPIQARVMMFLTADNPEETNWEACRPVPGSLFVVGDPKQSIYRFRRADIVTYNKVKEIIQRFGRVLTLQANFRSRPELLSWVNDTFGGRFPSKESPEAPVYVALQPGKEAVTDGEPWLRRLQIPVNIEKDEISAHEADVIARAIRDALDRGPGEAEGAERAKPGDFLIITRTTRNLFTYSRALQAQGIPHTVTGGNAVNRSTELGLLLTCLASVTRPEDPVALVGALRSGLFGISDAVLYEFKRMGGSFSYLSAVPDAMAPAGRAAMEDAFTRLKTYGEWIRTMPALSAVERIVADLGLAVTAATGSDGNEAAGGLLKAVELLREAERSMWTVRDVTEYIESVIEGEEKHDAIPALSGEGSAVRVMNLHQAKGLEAPYVFLADPTGIVRPRPILHIDRSGTATNGFMVIEKKGKGHSSLVIAEPADWDTYKPREKLFQEHELIRLLYVAATRAGRELVITQRDNTREGGNSQNPWRDFDEHLSGAPELVPGRNAERPRELESKITHADFSAAEERSCLAWERILEATYRTAEAKTFALADRGPSPYGSDQGTEWGTVIHELLQLAMTAPDADLLGPAMTALSEQDLDPQLSDAAVETVRAVMASELWSRASKSAQRLAEVPFRFMLPEPAPDGSGAPTLVRGVIDLAFLESDGWVIVDYKTDRRSADHIHDLVELYRGQVELYATAWESITGTRVAERGLYFTHCGQYVRLAADAGAPSKAS